MTDFADTVMIAPLPRRLRARRERYRDPHQVQPVARPVRQVVAGVDAP